MRDVILLLKLQMRGFLSINRLRNRLGDGKTALLMAVCSVCTLAALVLSGFYCFMIAYGMNEMGLLSLYPPLTVAISCLFGLFTAIYKAPHVLFSQDDMLLSLPISAKSIVASRFLQLYCYSLISDILIMIPALTAYGWYARPDVGFCLRYLLAVPFIPVMPLMVGCLLGAAVQAIASRFRHTNLVVILGGFALMLGLLYFQMQIPKMVRMQDLFLGLEHLLSTWIGRIYPLAGLYTQGVMEGHWLSLMGYIVLALAIFAAMIHLVAHFFKPICSGLSGVRAKARFQMRDQRRKSIFATLYAKEARRYFSTPVYVLNTAVGALLLIGGSVALCMTGIPQFLTILELTGMEDRVFQLLPLISALILSTMSISASSISMEGSSLWQIMTLPVTPDQVYAAKIGFSLSLQLPTVALSALILGWGLKLDAGQIAPLLVLPGLCALYNSVTGLLINLLFPKFKWKNPAVVVKQSAASLIATAAGLLPMAGMICYLIYSPYKGFSPIHVCLAFLGLLTLACLAVFKIKGQALYLRLAGAEK